MPAPSLGLPPELLWVPPELGAPTPAILGWGAFLLLALGLGVVAWRRRLPAPLAETVPLSARELGLAALATLALAVVVSWPMATAQALVQRNFDGFGSAWLLWHLGRGGLVEQVDTWLFLLLGVPLRWLLGPEGAYAWATVLGLWASGVATWWVARARFGASGLGAFAAAAALCANPLVGSAIVEGHGGLLVGLGLPLLLGALQAEPGERPWRWSALVVGAGLLCALQSGYFAILAGVLTLWWCGWQRRPLWRVLAVASLPGIGFALLVLGQTQGSGGGGDWSWYQHYASMLPPPDRASLDTLAGFPEGSAGLLHGTRHGVVWALLVLGVVLPLLRGARVARGLALLALVGLGLALGPELRLTCAEGAPFSLPLPYAWVQSWFPPLALFRIPVRWLWLTYLGAGLGAAWVISVWPRRELRWGLLALLLLELMWTGARPWETRSTLAEAPTAYDALSQRDVVLDLWPVFDAEHPQAVAIKELSCYYQVHHGAGLPMTCLDIQLEDSALLRLNQRAVPTLLQGGDPGLEAEGITALAFHPDAFSAGPREALRRALEARYGAPVARSVDGGEAVDLYRLGR